MADVHFDWRLHAGIASRANTCLLLLVLVSFPLILYFTNGFGVADTLVGTPQHTRAYVMACAFLTAFLWLCFAIAITGILTRAAITWRQLIAARWNRWQAAVRDLGIALATLLAMGIIGNLANHFLAPLQQETPMLRAIANPQNTWEALAFLASALTAGFVEEFVFRGYLQRQFQALFGNTLLAATAQVLVFTLGHIYQGWARLIPVFLIGLVLTAVALWRKSLVPGIIAHALGDGLVTFLYFARNG